MKALLIDDEKAALIQMERLIKADGRIEVIGAFTTVRESLEYLRTCKVDFVFLDIGMPEMSGLAAAEYILQLDPDIRIVYVTAYSEYAVEAFELNALDYLLKPVSTGRFAKTVTRMLDIYRRKNNTLSQATQTEYEPSILCFHRLELRGGTPGVKLKWRTSKAQELFAFLLHSKGQWVSKNLLLDTLWPDYAPDKGLTHLHTSVYQIRKLLREWDEGAGIEFAQDCYRLTLEGIVTDVELFVQELERILKDPSPSPNASSHHYDNALRLYSGHYLEEHDFWWAKPRQEQLRQQYIELVLAIAREETTAGHETQAIKRLVSARDKDPYSEEICQQLLQACASLRDYELLQTYYHSFAEMLHKELGSEPDSKTTALYQSLMQH
ncbi:response regulator [Paenibacillus sp. GCM10012306]|uniref:response regulator n=1 Tax=Paenibacillus sp. GCM10012306 TaxID=3317342 RepID=UPI00360C5566